MNGVRPRFLPKWPHSWGNDITEFTLIYFFTYVAFQLRGWYHFYLFIFFFRFYPEAQRPESARSLVISWVSFCRGGRE